jgi:CBS domain-containing protein
MAELRDLLLVDAAVPEAASFADAVAALFAANVPAIAVLDPGREVVGIVAEGDLIRAVFPGYLGELHHSAFLPDDLAELDERARLARAEPVVRYARRSELLREDDSQTHAAERFIHTGEHALPVVDADGRFRGMLSISALCHARLDRADAAG